MSAEAKVFRRKPKRILTESFILGLHKQMFGGIWKWADTRRKSDKNIGGPGGASQRICGICHQKHFVPSSFKLR